MSDLNINVKVNGEDKVKKLKTTLTELDEGARSSSFSFKNLTKTWVAMGAALASIIVAGSKWKNELDEITGNSDSLANATNNLEGAFGASSSAILEATHLADAYKTSVNALADALDGLAIALGGVSNAEKEYLKWKKEEDAWLKESVARQIADQKKLQKAREDADVSQQKHLSRLEEIVAKEQEAARAKQLAEEQAYEALLKKLDAEIDAKNAREEVVQATEEAIQAEEEYTQAIKATTQARESGTKAVENYTTTTKGYMSQSYVWDTNRQNGITLAGASSVGNYMSNGYNPYLSELRSISRTNRKMARD